MSDPVVGQDLSLLGSSVSFTGGGNTGIGTSLSRACPGLQCETPATKLAGEFNPSSFGFAPAMAPQSPAFAPAQTMKFGQA